MKPRVLLIDDDAFIRESVKRTLIREPYELLVAESAQVALEIIEALPVQVVVSDQKMPGIKGTELLKHIHDSRPEIVTILFSGEATLGTALEAINVCRVFRFLQKPCPPATLALTIREALKHHSLVAQSQRLLELVQMQAAYIRNIEPEMGSSGAHEKGQVHTIRTEQEYDLNALIQRATEEVESIEQALQRVSKGRHNPNSKKLSGGSE